MRNTAFKTSPFDFFLSAMASQSLGDVDVCDTCHVKDVYNMMMCFINMRGQTCAHALMQGLYACGACFACECYGLVTGTCLHSSTARGRLSKNSSNPTGVCVLPSLPSPPLATPGGFGGRGLLGHRLWTVQEIASQAFTHISVKAHMTMSGSLCVVQTYLVVADWRATPLSMCWYVHSYIEKDTHTENWCKHHPTTKT